MADRLPKLTHTQAVIVDDLTSVSATMADMQIIYARLQQRIMQIKATSNPEDWRLANEYIAGLAVPIGTAGSTHPSVKQEQ